LLAAIGVEHRAQQPKALPAQIRRIGQMALLLEDMLLQRCPASTTVLGWPMRRGPPFFEQDAIPALQVLFGGRREAVIAASGHVGWKMLAQEGAHLLSEGLVSGAQLQLHRFNGRSYETSVRSRVVFPPLHNIAKYSAGNGSSVMAACHSLTQTRVAMAQ